MEENIVTIGVPLSLFEVVMESPFMDIDVFNGDETFTLKIDSFSLAEYYRTFYTDNIESGSPLNEDNMFIPLYIDVKDKKLLNPKEAKDIGFLQKVESNIVYFDLGNGEEKTEILNIKRSDIEDYLFDNKGITINTFSGSVYFSVDYLSIVLSNKKFENIDSFPFLINDKAEILGVLWEPDFDGNSEIQLIKI